MESLIKKRQGNKLILPEEWVKRIEKKLCPACGKENHRQFRCCSVKCTTNFWKEAWWSYDIRVKVFERDNYTCQNCGVSNKPFWDWIKRYNDWDYKLKNVLMSNKSSYVSITKDKMPIQYNLEDDHIKPIALGGDEYDMKNRQTLCKKCHRKKTGREAKEFARARKGQINILYDLQEGTQKNIFQ